ncbi:hypothetical protein BGW36DRAFT_423897 [Talaromyces proteolyticus]|uniref:P-loop containing nucleoside triphosphate hydrolase protein n=1 Tax=Talaromyces proteolyticus TaxID=1131652 RepID=A0AAD4KWG9_9EURO|nr:uncharacterized protein BGW36DRAFT_423897 [Talaromyces proteolyticus]KAH8701590.1 hypothetical protein BGW36DRAFT_423897 [Talaromyces proteolyticus]
MASSIILFPLVVLLLALAITSPLQQTRYTGRKVFVIGLSRTGTTSLGDALASLSLRRSGWNDIHSRHLYHMFAANRTAPLISYARKYDALEDLPWALAYKHLATAFPDARFILTTRMNETNWLQSMERHTERREWIGNKKTFGCKKVCGEKCRETFLETYREHNKEVRKFFEEEGQGRLLEIVIDAPTERKSIKTGDANITAVDVKWVSLIEFLGLEKEVDRKGGWGKLGSFPKSNAGNRARNFQNRIENAWSRAMNAFEEGTLKGVQSAVALVKGLSHLTAIGL